MPSVRGRTVSQRVTPGPTASAPPWELVRIAHFWTPSQTHGIRGSRGSSCPGDWGACEFEQRHLSERRDLGARLPRFLPMVPYRRGRDLVVF